ncbi:Gfo/Idh/MocA family oxidoreductase [Paracoccus sp. 1_MG-2023]|uniref:Gfo/Idh/MocA family protein n=1 Tax=unclassified Paracoccus (in: a-proteobacteria) TaxID=2688777 RepID=UPI001C0A3594|nr:MULTISPECIES: Gfo/Idh/MocA family oxidoreductase [unclassified Paracoccus (in: a-proteobacteria)]MBU2957985.1 Gfo/Idh/MocA family oxidoreductase [Paracoccus sp. C2R09]MDO6668821.1 Gfo/Idh/MocA family oxidoreductase [Paracoccus sp. 1_MG-2023]
MTKSIDADPVGVALIGAGMIAPTHVAALSDARDKVRLRTVISRRPERAQHLAELYAGETPEFSSDLAAVAADPSIQVAIVATPPSVRRDVIAELARSGTHILLEKPVGRNPHEAREVVEICEKAGVTLGVLFQHRMRAPSQAAARLVADGGLGRLGLVEIAVPLWRAQSYYDELDRGTYERDGGGVLITNAIHSIDLALSLTGPVASVQAMTATTSLHRMEAEDFAVAGLRFRNGAAGSLIAGTAMYPHRTEVIRLHFDNASLRLDKDALQIDWRDGRHEVEAQDDAPRDVNPLSGGKHEWHQAVIEDFIDALRHGRKPMVTGREALISHDLIAAIEASSRDGRRIDLTD